MLLTPSHPPTSPFSLYFCSCRWPFSSLTLCRHPPTSITPESDRGTIDRAIESISLTKSQSSQSSHKILSTKMEYENHCRDVEVVPQNYISTNSKLFHQENLPNIHPGSIRSQGLLILDHIIMELLEMKSELL